MNAYPGQAMQWGRRCRMLGICCCLIFSVLFLWLRATAVRGVDSFGNPFQPDFAALHVAGEMARNGEWKSIYDQREVVTRADRLLYGEAREGGYLYLYPPFVTWACAVASLVAFPHAAWLWLLANVLLGIWLARKIPELLDCPRLAGQAAMWLFVGSLPFWRTLLFGQNGFWLLGAGTLFFQAWKQERFVVAGLWLSVGWCKPQLFFGLFIWMALTGPNRLRMGWLLGSAIMAGAGTLPAHGELWRAWVGSIQLMRGAGENQLWLHSLHNAFGLWNDGGRILWLRVVEYAMWGVTALGWAWVLLEKARAGGKNQREAKAALGWAMLGTLILTPRLYQYDLIWTYPLLVGYWSEITSLNQTESDRQIFFMGIGITCAIFYLSDIGLMMKIPLLTCLALIYLVKCSGREHLLRRCQTSS